MNSFHEMLIHLLKLAVMHAYIRMQELLWVWDLIGLHPYALQNISSIKLICRLDRFPGVVGAIDRTRLRWAVQEESQVNSKDAERSISLWMYRWCAMQAWKYWMLLLAGLDLCTIRESSSTHPYQVPETEKVPNRIPLSDGEYACTTHPLTPFIRTETPAQCRCNRAHVKYTECHWRDFWCSKEKIFLLSIFEPQQTN